MKSLLVVPRRSLITLSKQRGLAVSMLFACLLLIANPGAHGQSPTGITNVDDATSTPIPGAGHDYIKMLSETVNPANGSVSLRIELPVPKGRGITPSFSIDYDSGGVHHLEPSSPGTATWVSNGNGLPGTAAGGWSFSIPTLSFTHWSATEGEAPNTFSCDDYSDYMFTDMSGGGHAAGGPLIDL